MIPRKVRSASSRASIRVGLAAVLLLTLLLPTLFEPVTAARKGVEAEYPWQMLLKDANGQLFNLSDYRGKVLVLSFFYTTCGYACPIQTARLAQVQQQLNDDTLTASRFVSVSIHPEIDTPEAIDAFVRPFGIDNNHWQFGAAENSMLLNELLAQAGVKTKQQSNQTDHTMKILLVDPSGRTMQRYAGRFSIERVAREISTLVRLNSGAIQ